MKKRLFRSLKRATAILLVGVVSSFCIAGCGKKGTGEDAGTPPREKLSTGNPSSLFEPAVKGDVLPTLSVTTENGLPVKTADDCRLRLEAYA